MKGKNYLMITSILIIASAVVSIILCFISNILPAYLHAFRLLIAVVCLLSFVTGILGFVYRDKAESVCIFLGFLLCSLSVLSIPFLFWIGRGSAPFGLVLIGFVYMMIFGLYLTGVFLNRKAPKKEVRFIPYDYIPLRH